MDICAELRIATILADPMVQTVMRADGVDAGALKATLFNTAVALKARAATRERAAADVTHLSGVLAATGACGDARVRGAA